MSPPNIHLHEDLASSNERVPVQTQFGKVTGGRASNGAAVFLGTRSKLLPNHPSNSVEHVEVPYALPPVRFSEPVALPKDYRYEDKEYIREDGCELFSLGPG